MKKSKFQSNFNILHVWLVKKWLVNWKLNYTKNILCVFKLWNYKSKQVIFWNPNDVTRKPYLANRAYWAGLFISFSIIFGVAESITNKKPLLRFYRWTTDRGFWKTAPGYFIGAQNLAPNFFPIFFLLSGVCAACSGLVQCL